MSVAPRIFLDTNVLVYLFDADTPVKRQRAREIVSEIGAAAVLSTQVLQEFFVSVTRKLARPLRVAEAEAAVHDLAALDVVVIDVPMVKHAVALSRADRLPFWDALIVEAARAHGCRRLLSEDLQDGRVFGDLRVENPFRRLAEGKDS
jgi:predicted nucleic acid-binding protein